MSLTVKPKGADPLVLLVEDHDLYRRAVARMIRMELGYEVAEASSGLEAIRFCERRVPDLVISDEQMMGMSGTMLLAEVGRRWPLTRRILLSGFTTGEMVVSAAYPVLDKSLDYWVISNEIRRYALGL
jgi:DNA-binding NarL/FixJ family response regulator